MKYAQQTSPLSLLDVHGDAMMFNCRQRITRETESEEKRKEKKIRKNNTWIESIGNIFKSGPAE